MLVLLSLFAFVRFSLAFISQNSFYSGGNSYRGRCPPCPSPPVASIPLPSPSPYPCPPCPPSSGAVSYVSPMPLPWNPPQPVPSPTTICPPPQPNPMPLPCPPPQPNPMPLPCPPPQPNPMPLPCPPPQPNPMVLPCPPPQPNPMPLPCPPPQPNPMPLPCPPPLPNPMPMPCSFPVQPPVPQPFPCSPSPIPNPCPSPNPLCPPSSFSFSGQNFVPMGAYQPATPAIAMPQFPQLIPQQSSLQPGIYQPSQFATFPLPQKIFPSDYLVQSPLIPQKPFEGISFPIPVKDRYLTKPDDPFEDRPTTPNNGTSKPAITESSPFQPVNHEQLQQTLRAIVKPVQQQQIGESYQTKPMTIVVPSGISSTYQTQPHSSIPGGYPQQQSFVVNPTSQFPSSSFPSLPNNCCIQCGFPCGSSSSTSSHRSNRVFSAKTQIGVNHRDVTIENAKSSAEINLRANHPIINECTNKHLQAVLIKNSSKKISDAKASVHKQAQEEVGKGLFHVFCSPSKMDYIVQSSDYCVSDFADGICYIFRTT